MRLYRALLRLYPTSFRHEYGEEMARVHAERRRDAAGPAGAALLWFSVIPEIIGNACLVHADILRQDLRYLARALARARGFAATAIIIVALGIGATSAAFALADFVLIQPLPFPAPDRLVSVWQTASGYSRMELSPGNYRDWTDGTQSFARVGAYYEDSATLLINGDPQRLDGAAVTSDLFATLGVAPALGTTIAGGPDIVVSRTNPSGLPIVISDALWRAAFGGDPAIVGRPITLDNRQHVIAGVMPPSFSFPAKGMAFWMPMVFSPDGMNDRGDNSLHAVARLAPGATLGSARQELAARAERSKTLYPKDDRDVGSTANGLHEERVREARPLVLALAGAALCVLLIVCANLANLLLARALTRRQEMAVRAALGAGRERLARQLATESLVLTVAGGLTGIALAALTVPLLWRLVPAALPTAGTPGIDARVMAFAALLTLVTAIVFGLIPMARSAGADVQALRDGARTTGGRGQRLRNALVIAEVVATVVLLVTTGLLMRALWSIQGTSPGFRVDHVLTLRTELPMPKYAATGARTAYYSRILDQVRAVPGVQDAAFISFLPMVMGGGIWPVGLPGEPQERVAGHTASLRFVTPEFFRTLDIAVHAGRGIVEHDALGTQKVAVVSDSFARRYWPGQDPLGRTFGFGFDTRTIVGTVGDIRVRGLDSESEPQVYLPARQMADNVLTGYAPRDLAIRATTPLETLVPAVRAIIRGVDPEQPITDVRPMRDIIDAETASRGVQVRAIAAFAALAFLLSAIGLHGVLSFAVSQRTQEIGVRMAIGASRADIFGLVSRQGAALVFAGLVPGLVLAYAAARALGSLLIGVTPGDRVTYAAVIGLTLLMTLAGTLLPTRRAVRIDPIKAIRQ